MRILHNSREVIGSEQVPSDPLDHGQDLAGRGGRYGGVGRGAVGDGQVGKLQAALEAVEVGTVHEIGQRVCGSDGRLGVI